MSTALFLNCYSAAEELGHQEHSKLIEVLAGLSRYGIQIGQSHTSGNRIRPVKLATIQAAEYAGLMVTTEVQFSVELGSEVYDPAIYLTTQGRIFRPGRHYLSYGNAQLMLPPARNLYPKYDPDGERSAATLELLEAFCQAAALPRAHLYDDHGACIPVNAHYLYYN
jgi:hypothetical protein